MQGYRKCGLTLASIPSKTVTLNQYYCLSGALLLAESYFQPFLFELLSFECVDAHGNGVIAVGALGKVCDANRLKAAPSNHGGNSGSDVVSKIKLHHLSHLNMNAGLSLTSRYLEPCERLRTEQRDQIQINS